MRRRLAVALTLAVVVAVVAGVSAEAAKTKRHVVRGQGISLVLPSSWQALDGRAALTTAAIARIESDNPELAPYLRQLEQPSSPLKFFGFDPVVRNGFATNVNVIVVSLGTRLTFADYRRAHRRGGGQAPAVHGLDSSVVTIDGARTVRLQYQIRLGGNTLRTLQYAFPRGSKSYVVTYTTVPQQAGRYRSTFASSAASIRFR